MTHSLRSPVAASRWLVPAPSAGQATIHGMTAAPEPSTETVVMKFGGSSVADPDKIKHVAHRLVEARERGVRVVATVSAMGDATDGLLELARQVSPQPHPRELDMLLSTGERISCALVAMAVHDLGYEAVSFTGLAGRDHHRPRPHEGEDPRDHACPRARGARARPDRPRRRLPGLLARHDGRDDARPRRHRRDRGRARRRARRARARSTPTSRASSRQTRGSSRTRGSSTASRTRRCSRWPPRARRC